MSNTHSRRQTMESSPAETADTSPITRRMMLRVTLLNALIWGTIATLGAAGTYRDELRIGRQIAFAGIWADWLNTHVPLFVLSSCLWLLLKRYPARVASLRATAWLYLVLALTCFPLHMLYITLPRWLTRNTDQGLITFVLSRDNYLWFLELAWFTGTFSVVITLHAWHLAQRRAQALRQSETTNLQLQLALEQQRLQGMRQQLEPHFMFNALNAISALVRANEKPVALEGIASLSELLRYALKASSRDWVTLGEELEMNREYLALQQLRYGTRLRADIRGVSPAIEQIDCPPLLLQPLIENAFRHELDCHDQPGMIDLHFALEGEQVHIHLSNTLLPGTPPNPGLGLGLAQAKARLGILYGAAASLSVQREADRFTIHLILPSRRPQ